MNNEYEFLKNFYNYSGYKSVLNLVPEVFGRKTLAIVFFITTPVGLGRERFSIKRSIFNWFNPASYAEEEAIKSAYNIIESPLYGLWLAVLRHDSNNNLIGYYPPKYCMDIIRKSGIQRIGYFNGKIFTSERIR